MKEQLISFKVAKLAKKKGFDEPCMNYIWNDQTIIESVINSSTHGIPIKQEEFTDKIGRKKIYTICVPTQTLLQIWLREEHNILLYTAPIQGAYPNDGIKWLWCIYKIETSNLYDTYEEALEEGLYEALKLIEI